MHARYLFYGILFVYAGFLLFIQIKSVCKNYNMPLLTGIEKTQQLRLLNVFQRRMWQSKLRSKKIVIAFVILSYTLYYCYMQ